MTTLRTFNGTAFAEALRTLLEDVVAGHPDRSAILDGITAGKVAVRVTIDQHENVLTIGAIVDGWERRVIAGLDMSGGSSAWQLVCPDWDAPPAEMHATLH